MKGTFSFLLFCPDNKAVFIWIRDIFVSLCVCMVDLCLCVFAKEIVFVFPDTKPIEWSPVFAGMHTCGKGREGELLF